VSGKKRISKPRLGLDIAMRNWTGRDREWQSCRSRTELHLILGSRHITDRNFPTLLEDRALVSVQRQGWLTCEGPASHIHMCLPCCWLILQTFHIYPIMVSLCLYPAMLLCTHSNERRMFSCAPRLCWYLSEPGVYAAQVPLHTVLRSGHRFFNSS
jgi:hypothetical protein